MTPGVRGGADLIVHVVLRLDNQEWDLIDVGARERTARRASSEACDICAVNPCLAAIVSYWFLISKFLPMDYPIVNLTDN